MYSYARIIVRRSARADGASSAQARSMVIPILILILSRSTRGMEGSLSVGS